MARDFTSANTEYFRGSPSPITARPCTLAAWFRKDVSTGSMNIVNVVDEAVTSSRLSLSIDPANLLEARDTNTVGDIAVSSIATSINTWHHGIATITSNIRRDVYLDNGSTGSNTNIGAPSIPANFDAIHVGRFGDSTPNWEFDGAIAEVAVYNVVISAASRAALAAGVSPLLVEPQNLVFYAPMTGSGDEQDLIGGATLIDTNTVGTFAHPRIIMSSAQILQFPQAAAGGATIPVFYNHYQRLMRQ